ncbi:Rsc2p [Sugiyamaella lignohabitans]|uniref:Rsc2p n=1 Tax=Sugiyamaella lignohabitans TaxID=796027 RepID=A0A167FBJ7_9ASCO|nr:Rsc2p [Sugiyamaella lignohabitans]ANB15074.1 Rsc2p [Sugiyamaella lignohabitans]
MSENEEHKDVVTGSDVASGSEIGGGETGGGEVSEQQLMKQLLDGVYELDAGDHKAANVFHALPERRLTAYYKIIKRPFSLYRIKQNIAQKKYTDVAEYIRDFAQITYNARVFNRKSSTIYADAVVVDNYLRDVVIETLRKTGRYTEEQLKYPEIGPLPDGSDNDDEPYYEEPSVTSGQNDYDDDGDDDDNDDDEDDYDDDGYGPGAKRRSSRPRRSVLLGQRRKREEEEEDARQAAASLDNERKSKRRGRPPIVDKPHEHRIKNILRAIRRERIESTGRVLSAPFERLPDGKMYPDYYTVIQHPISLDQIKKNIKGRKYQSVEMFLADMNLMFENAKQFNTKGSQIYQDAETLSKVMEFTADEEKKKPDSAYQDLESSHARTARLPLDEFDHRGEKYTVGDWVHLSNPNDPAKPIIGQIFRIWQVSDGQKWVNVCWYFRPEQTVHRYDRVFYENEVFKSGQYRDHLVSEILEKCFVMFVSRYIRGRPSSVTPRTMVYCCDNRYNEVDKTFNRIRTWKACLPDEVRHIEYEIDYYERPLSLRKLPSPIKNLLPENATDDDPLPEPKMGADNAPPIVGGVYKRPPDAKEPLELPTPEGQGDVVGPFGPIGNALRTSRPRPGAQSANVSLVVPPSAGNTRFAAPMGPGSMTPGATLAGRGSPYVNRQIGAVPGALPPHLQFQGGVPPITPTTFTLPPTVQNLLPVKQLHGVAKQSRTNQMLWFASTPLWIPDRHVTHHIRKELGYNFQLQGAGYDVGDDSEQRVPSSRSTVGHSAKYLAWRLKQEQK